MFVHTGRRPILSVIKLLANSASCVATNSTAMSERHLEKGSPLPEVKPDILRIYSMRFCPYAERTRLVLAHKNIPHETVNVNLMNKPDWLFERNPLGLVPVIEYKGHVTAESFVCDEFLEELFPDNALLPSCPFKRAAARLFMYKSERKTYIGLLRPPSSEKFFERLERYKTHLREYEQHLATTGKPFFGGSQVGMSDFHVWPFFERIPAISDVLGMALLSSSTHPRLTVWVDAMRSTEAVKKCLISTELHKKFLSSYQSGSPQYDIELDLSPNASKL